MDDQNITSLNELKEENVTLSLELEASKKQLKDKESELEALKKENAEQKESIDNLIKEMQETIFSAAAPDAGSDEGPAPSDTPDLQAVETVQKESEEMQKLLEDMLEEKETLQGELELARLELERQKDSYEKKLQLLSSDGEKPVEYPETSPEDHRADDELQKLLTATIAAKEQAEQKIVVLGETNRKLEENITTLTMEIDSLKTEEEEESRKPGAEGDKQEEIRTLKRQIESMRQTIKNLAGQKAAAEMSAVKTSGPSPEDLENLEDENKKLQQKIAELELIVQESETSVSAKGDVKHDQERLQARIDELESLLSAQELNKTETENQITELKTAQEDLLRTIDQLKGEAAQNIEEIKKLTSEVNSLKEERDRWLEKEKLFHQEIEDSRVLEKKHNAMEEELHLSRSRASNLEHEKTKLEERITALQDSVGDSGAMMKDLQQSVVDLQENVTTLQTEVAEKDSLITVLQRKSEDFTRKTQQLESEKSELSSQLLHIEGKLAAEATKISALEEHYQQELESREKDITRLTEQLSDVETEKNSIIDDNKNQLEVFQTKCSELEQELLLLKEEKNCFERDSKNRQEENETELEKVYSLNEYLEQKLDEVEKEKEMLINNLEDKLQHAAQTEENLRENVVLLEKEGTDYKTILSEKEAELNAKISEISILDEKVTFLQEQMEKGLSQEESFTLQLKEKEQVIQTLNDEKNEQSLKREELAQKFAELEHQMSAGDSELIALKKENEKLTATIDSQNSEHDVLRQERAAFSEQLSAMKEARDTFEEQLRVLNLTLEEKQENITQIQSENASLRQQLQEYSESQERAIESREAELREHTEVSEQLSLIKEERDTFEEQLRVLNLTLEEKQENITQIQSENASLRQQLHEYSESQEQESKSKEAGLMQRLQEVTADLETIHEEKKALQMECDSLKGANENLNAELQEQKEMIESIKGSSQRTPESGDTDTTELQNKVEEQAQYIAYIKKRAREMKTFYENKIQEIKDSDTPLVELTSGVTVDLNDLKRENAQLRQKIFSLENQAHEQKLQLAQLENQADNATRESSASIGGIEVHDVAGSARIVEMDEKLQDMQEQVTAVMQKLNEKEEIIKRLQWQQSARNKGISTLATKINAVKSQLEPHTKRKIRELLQKEFDELSEFVRKL